MCKANYRVYEVLLGNEKPFKYENPPFSKEGPDDPVRIAEIRAEEGKGVGVRAGD
jgi:hypothetical protein